MTFIPIVIGALVPAIKRLLQALEDLEIRGRVETIQTTALSRSARILRRVLETWETSGHSNSSDRPSANADLKKKPSCSKIDHKALHVRYIVDRLYVSRKEEEESLASKTMSIQQYDNWKIS